MLPATSPSSFLPGPPLVSTTAFTGVVGVRSEVGRGGVHGIVGRDCGGKKEDEIFTYGMINQLHKRSIFGPLAYSGNKFLSIFFFHISFIHHAEFHRITQLVCDRYLGVPQGEEPKRGILLYLCTYT
jgi:hypothetical protein